MLAARSQLLIIKHYIQELQELQLGVRIFKYILYVHLIAFEIFLEIKLT